MRQRNNCENHDVHEFDKAHRVLHGAKRLFNKIPCQKRRAVHGKILRS